MHHNGRRRTKNERVGTAELELVSINARFITYVSTFRRRRAAMSLRDANIIITDKRRSYKREMRSKVERWLVSRTNERTR